VVESEQAPTFGFTFEVGLEPINVNVDRMINNFRLGINELVIFLERILSPDDLSELQKLIKQDSSQFYFSDELWVRVVYSFASSFHHRIWPIEQLMKSMIPIYLGRTASFVIENKDTTSNEVEQKIENLCREYEKLKPFLLDKWENYKL
jgi:hypothetical protein